MAIQDKINFADIIEKAPEGVVVVDRKGVVRFVNRAGMVILGRSKDELVDHPLGMAISRGKEIETEIRRNSGVTSLVRMQVSDIEWSGEKASLVFLLDITDRRNAEEAMRRSEESFRLAFEEAKDAIFWADVKTGMLVNCNKSAERLMEAPAEEIVGRHFMSIHPPDLADEVAEQFRREVRERQVAADKSVIMTKSGRRVDVIVSTSVMKIGGREIMQGVFRDMTDINRAEEIARLSDERYGLLANNVKDLVWTADLGLKLTYVSPSSSIVLGYKPEECMRLDTKDLLTEESQGVVMKTLADALKEEREKPLEKRPPITIDIQHLKKDGSIIWCEVKAGFLRDDSGRPTGLIGVTRDITDHKKAEAKIKNAYERLKETQDGLVQSEKLAAIGKFSSGIAHEVKNPLGVIVSAAEFLEAKLSQADADTDEALEKIKESALRAAFILHSFLEYARPSKRLAERIDARHLVKEASDSLMIKPLLASIETYVEAESGEVSVEVDKNQMIQVIFNLIKNALEAMPEGGKIKVSIRKEMAHEAIPGGSAAVIEIRDNGRGIGPEHLNNLFRPFFTTKEAGKGTGLGLFVSKTIVENHGGSLAIESVPGKGTVARIILPLAGDRSSNA